MNKRNRENPPRIGEKLLRLILPESERRALLGDYEELYKDLAKRRGRFIANLWYGLQIVLAIHSVIWDSTKWSVIMIRSYLKIASRILRKYKGYSFINISGLAVGLACSILMFLWIHDELSFDRFHENSNELYRVITKIPTSNEITHSARTANAVGPALVEQYPDIVNYTRYQCFEEILLEANGKSYLCNYFAFADPSFFEMFSFSFIKGDPKSAFNDKFSIVITERMARRYFGKEDPMGKIMNVQLHRTPFLVTGVIKDMPETSHIHFECIVPFSYCVDWHHADPQSWKISLFYTYLQLQKGRQPEDVHENISGIIKQNDETSLAEIYLQPLKNIHLGSNLSGDLDNYKKGDIKYIYIYFITAFSVLIIACINFMNLSTARSSRRAKEVGLRKVIGAQKSHLLGQFLGESILFSIFAFLLAVILVIIILPTFNNLTDKKLVLDFSINPMLMTGIVGITLLTGVISGIYPAFFLSALQPVNALKNSGFKSGRGGIYLRKTLGISQFVLSGILITGTMIVYNQLDFIKNKPLGYDNRYIINPGSYFNNVLKDELLENPNIISISQGTIPSRELPGNSSFQWEGKSPDQEITLYPARVDYFYLETFGMSMKEGRFFSREFISDNNNIVINETAAQVMGLTNPIGTKVKYEIPNMDTGRLDEKEAVIIGVMKDFHQSSLHNSIEPMIFEFNEWHPFVSIKIKPDNIPETLTFLEDTWKKHIDYPCSYTFLKETTDNFYVNEEKIGAVFSYFSLLAIFISCLGLFGLASYTTEQRKKEIGIRKLLGASVPEIFVLLSWRFIKWVVLANVIAWPVAYYFMNKWMQNFAYRVNISVWIFILSGLVVLAIALLTVSYQTIKAATANPVESLKYE